MTSRFAVPATATGLVVLAAIIHLSNPSPAIHAQTRAFPTQVTQGALLVRGTDLDQPYECPLKHTDVQAEISGFIARVNVTQEFENTGKDNIEAVYVFPLPHRAAVDRMTLLVNDRTVKGVVKRREEARAVYEAARNAGKVASLLDQERPNIFTQQVTNIAPGAKVKVVISYVETLSYEAGTYQFTFPMVVGPRYIPGTPVGKIGGGWSYDTDKVPDASKITPIVTKPGTRAGHDISVRVALDAGVPIENVAASTHEVNVERQGVSRAQVVLKNTSELPNKDFVLRYDVAGKKINDAILTHKSDKGGFFTLFLQPPDKVSVEDVAPKELVFVLDTSGSMSGFPIEKAKETMRLAIDSLNPLDTFNLITFAGDTHVLFPSPVPATRENVRAAQAFLNSRHGGGGTEMMKAIRTALAPSESTKHVRIVCFMTDGYVGNEAEIISYIQTYNRARVFSFGIGASVNRYLLDKMAEAGRGEVEYVSLKDDGSAAARRFHERVRNPLLTDVAVDWNGLPVTDVFPAKIPDLFSAKPLVITGKYTSAAKGTVRIRGTYAGRPITREVPVTFADREPRHDVLGTLWARTKIDALMHGGVDAREEITTLGLNFQLMTQFTSFVAVEEAVVVEGGKPRTVQVPVEMPEGVSYQGVFGEADQAAAVPVANHVAPRRALSVAPFVTAEMSRPAPQTASPAGVGVSSSRAVKARDEHRLADGDAAVSKRKLDPALSGPDVNRHASSGRLRVQVFLSSRTEQVLAAIKALGFEIVVQSQAGLSVIGTVPVDKLKALSEIKAVKYVTLNKQ